VNEPVLIVRPDDGPIGPKHVALNVLLMVTIDVLDENINTLYKSDTLSDIGTRLETKVLPSLLFKGLNSNILRCNV
jgi:hypothetical protein